jgi:hypothetical protein
MGVLKCPHCGQTFTSSTDYLAHVKSCPNAPGAQQKPVTATTPATAATTGFDTDSWMRQWAANPYAGTASQKAATAAWMGQTFAPQQYAAMGGLAGLPSNIMTPEVQQSIWEQYYAPRQQWSWDNPWEVPPEISAVYDIVYDTEFNDYRIGNIKAGSLLPTGTTGEVVTVNRETIPDEYGNLWRVGYDANGNVTYEEYVGKTTDDATLTAWQEAQIDQQQKDREAQQAYWNAQLAQQLQLSQMPPQWRPGELELEQAQQQMMQQYYQWQQQEAQRQYEAALAAKGGLGWLESAAYTGQQPVIQPWMTPLMPGQYGYGGGPGHVRKIDLPVNGNLIIKQEGEAGGVGQPIPGWTPEEMSGMPALLNPSAQYWARMGPTAQQQYYGYKQARTGATPEETQFRLWSSSPPSGQYRGLTYTR